MNCLQAYDIYRFYHADEEETLALRGVSLAVHAGEIVALMGPSGSGKSSLLACLAGLDEPDGGYVEVMGERLTRRAELRRSTVRAKSIGILMQSGNLFDHLTVSENIMVGMRLAGQVNRQRIRELLAQVGLEHRMMAYPSQLSGGEAARAGLAVAMSTQPAILLADEPTAQVDSETEQRIMEVFSRRKEVGGATLIATHSQTLASWADRVILMRDGKVVSDSGVRDNGEL